MSNKLEPAKKNKRFEIHSKGFLPQLLPFNGLSSISPGIDGHTLGTWGPGTTWGAVPIAIRTAACSNQDTGDM